MYRVLILEKKKNYRMRKVSVRVSLCGMLKLIRVDTLRNLHSVGLLGGRLIVYLYGLSYLFYAEWYGHLQFDWLTQRSSIGCTGQSTVQYTNTELTSGFNEIRVGQNIHLIGLFRFNI